MQIAKDNGAKRALILIEQAKRPRSECRHHGTGRSDLLRRPEDGGNESVGTVNDPRTGPTKVEAEKPRLLFLMNRWQSAGGGIQTVNRELACAVASRFPGYECVALVTFASEAERSEARSHGVRLIAGTREDDWITALLSRDLADIGSQTVRAVVGHSYFSGEEAYRLRDRFFPEAINVHFIHMSPVDTESLKEHRKDRYVAEREAKLARELEIAQRSDLVICFGPLLRRYMSDQFNARSVNAGVVEITGGVSRAVVDRRRPERPTILCLGRTESLGVKGLDLFARAAGLLIKKWASHPSTNTKPRPAFIVRGAGSEPEALEYKLKDLARAESGTTPDIRVKPYTTNSEDLRADYLGASVFMMPSRAEGYGLVACEALSLGVPTLISSNAGLAEVVRKVASEHHLKTDWCLVDHDEDPTVTATRYADTALDILLHEDEAGTYVHQLREHLMPTCSWDAAASQLIRHIESMRAAAPTPVPTLAMTPRSVAAATETAATPPTLDPTDVLKKHADALRAEPGVIATELIVRRAILVFVEKGRTPTLPPKIEGIDVVVREVDPPQFVADVPIRPGDELISDSGMRGCIGPILRNAQGELRLLATSHVVAGAKRLQIRSSTGEAAFEAIVESIHLDEDLAILSPVPSIDASDATPSGVERPTIGESVTIIGPNIRLQGVIAGVEVTMRLKRAGKPNLDDLFHIDLATEAIRPGFSGALVQSSTGHLLGMVALASEAGRLVFAITLAPFLAKHGFEAIASSPRLARAVIAEQMTIGVLVDHPRMLESLLKRLPNATTERKGDVAYFRQAFPDRVLYLRALTSMGNLAAAVTATKMLRDIELDYVIVVGIAGGLLPRQKMGDVVVSSEIVHYEPATIHAGGLTPRFRVIGLTPKWLSDLVAPLPNVSVGAIASGEKFVTDRALLDDLLGGRGQVLAVEMEGAGVAEAVSQAGKSVPLVVVRGISDLVGGRKDDSGPARAAESATSVAMQLIERLPQA
jgi:5'-methylthioadenosine/S-adenosylhomocysteine nucleosidase